MTRVRNTDLRALVRELGTLYGAADMPSLAGRVTRCLRGLFDCELASFDLIDLRAVHWNTLVVSPALPDWGEFLASLQRHAHEHPIVSHAARHRYPHAIRISDLVGLRAYREMGIYQELCVPYVQSMDRQLGFVNKPTETLAFGVSVNRRGRDFSVEQRAQLELLRPHLLQAYRLAQEHHHLHERERTGREGVAAAVGGGWCQIDAAGRLEWATAGVERLLVRYFASWRAGSNRLPSEVLTLLRPALAAGRKSVEDAPCLGRSWSVVRTFGTLQIRLAARIEAGRWQLLLAEDGRDPDAETLARQHGLSRREAEALFWVGQGKTNEEIGMILSISKRTAQKHVERLLAKLDVVNRAAAVRMALNR